MIMCALVVQPKLYIADEPIVGLDPLAIRAFLQSMVEMKNQGAGILMSTHILAAAERYCDRFIVLHHGKIVMEGTLAEMRKKTGLYGAALEDIYIHVTKDDDK